MSRKKLKILNLLILIIFCEGRVEPPGGKKRDAGKM
jgi:hypothetical protein